MTTEHILHSDKIAYMRDFCNRNGLTLNLEGECGFGRECVGVHKSADESWPDYEWHDEEWEREDNNGDVWTPPNAYDKHPCVAVLGRGEVAESQLYDWLVWFDKNGFIYERSDMDTTGMNPLQLMMAGGHNHRMVKKSCP